MLFQGLFKASTVQTCVQKTRRESGKKRDEILASSQRTDSQLETGIAKQESDVGESAILVSVCRKARGCIPVASSDWEMDG